MSENNTFNAVVETITASLLAGLRDDPEPMAVVLAGMEEDGETTTVQEIGIAYGRVVGFLLSSCAQLFGVDPLDLWQAAVTDMRAAFN